MFLFINLAFAALLWIFSLVKFSWEFYVFWFIIYLELTQAAWISSEPKEKIKHLFTHAAIGCSFLLLLIFSTATFFAMHRPSFPISILGFTLCIAAFILRHYGIKNLGASFSEHIKSPKKVVTSGLYKEVRHPIYTSSILLVIGIPLILNAYLALSASLLVIMFILIRTELEEKSLCSEHANYSDYIKNTNKFFPKGLQDRQSQV